MPTFDRIASETAVRFLAAHFGTRLPRLRFTGRNPLKGTYVSKHRALRLAPHAAEWVVAHEFTHHLDVHTNGNHRRSHSDSFYSNLLRVCDALGIPRDRYPWFHEYATLQRWARRDGYFAAKEPSAWKP